MGLTKYFLSIGIPGDAKDFFNQVNSLSCLENSRLAQMILVIWCIIMPWLLIYAQIQMKVNASNQYFLVKLKLSGFDDVFLLL